MKLAMMQYPSQPNNGAVLEDLIQIWVSNLSLLKNANATASYQRSNVDSSTDNLTTTTTKKESERSVDYESIWKEQTREWLLARERRLHENQASTHGYKEMPLSSANEVVESIVKQAHQIVSQQQSFENNSGQGNIGLDSERTVKSHSLLSLFSKNSTTGSLFSNGGGLDVFFYWSIEQEKHKNDSYSLLQSLKSKVQFVEDVLSEWSEIYKFLQTQLLGPNRQQQMFAREIHQNWYGKLRQMQPRSEYDGFLMDLCYNIFLAAAASTNENAGDLQRKQKHGVMGDADAKNNVDEDESWTQSLIKLWWTMWMDYWTVILSSHNRIGMNKNNYKNTDDPTQLKIRSIIQFLIGDAGTIISMNQTMSNGSTDFKEHLWKLDPTGKWFQVWIMCIPPSTRSLEATTTTTRTEPLEEDEWFLSQVRRGCMDLFSCSTIQDNYTAIQKSDESSITAAHSKRRKSQDPLDGKIVGNGDERRLLLLLTKWLGVHRACQFPWHCLERTVNAAIPLTSDAAPLAPETSAEVTSNTDQLKIDDLRLSFVERLLQMITNTLYSYQNPMRCEKNTTTAISRPTCISNDDHEVISLCSEGLESLLNHAKYSKSIHDDNDQADKLKYCDDSFPKMYGQMQSRLAHYKTKLFGIIGEDENDENSLAVLNTLLLSSQHQKSSLVLLLMEHVPNHGRQKH